MFFRYFLDTSTWNSTKTVVLAETCHENCQNFVLFPKFGVIHIGTILPNFAYPINLGINVGGYFYELKSDCEFTVNQVLQVTTAYHSSATSKSTDIDRHLLYTVTISALKDLITEQYEEIDPIVKTFLIKFNKDNEFVIT